MTMKKPLYAGTALLCLALSSCLFQNEPLAPNQPPTIQSFTPEVTFFTMVAPAHCSFSIAATDPDGDELRYAWMLGDSVLSRADTVTFNAIVPGEFDIRVEARDGSRRASRDWHVTVVAKDDEPPRITYFFPEQSAVACTVGDTLEFHVRAEDDHPEALQYVYRLDGETLHAGSADLVNRFMTRGDFLLEGIAWDGQNGDTVSWNVSVTGYPDTIAPGPIDDLCGGPGSTDGTIWLEWTAPGDDGEEGRAASYVVRTSTYPIVTENDWREAEGKVGEPVPAPAGTRERMTIRNLVSAGFVYVTMRAADDFFNLSPLGNCIKVQVRGIDIAGRVQNAATGLGVPGILVSSGIRSDTTGADGTYFLGNVASYATTVSARDETVVGDPGALYDVVAPIGPIGQLVTLNFSMIPVFGLVNTADPCPYGDRFYAFYKGMTRTTGDLGESTVFRGWNHAPITVCNPAYLWRGVDCQAAARAAMDDWENAIGVDMFAETSSEAEADVVVIYDTLTTTRHHVETVATNEDGTPKRKLIWVYPLNEEVPITRFAQLVFAHELGHVIGLDHSRSTGHLMVGLTMPQISSPSTDEIRLVKCLYRFPYVYDYSAVIEE